MIYYSNHSEYKLTSINPQWTIYPEIYTHDGELFGIASAVVELIALYVTFSGTEYFSKSKRYFQKAFVMPSKQNKKYELSLCIAFSCLRKRNLAGKFTKFDHAQCTTAP